MTGFWRIIFLSIFNIFSWFKIILVLDIYCFVHSEEHLRPFRKRPLLLQAVAGAVGCPSHIPPSDRRDGRQPVMLPHSPMQLRDGHGIRARLHPVPLLCPGSRRARQEGASQCCHARKTQHAIAGFEPGRGPQNKACRKLPEARKDKKMDSP